MKGRTPAHNAARRPCEICGVEFQPYRVTAITCSRRCHDQLPHVKARAALYHARPDVRARKNRDRLISVNPARKAINRRWALHKYGLTPEQFDAMYAAQNGVCALCGNGANPNDVRAASRLHVDHDHTTGRVRALLCNGCNRGVGYLQDDPVLIRSAADYIERHRAA